MKRGAAADQYHQYEHLLKDAEAIGDKQVMQKIYDREHALGKTAHTVTGYGIGLILPRGTGVGGAGSYTIYSLFSGTDEWQLETVKLANRRSL
ncbi:hypothetical protein [Paenibacillus sp. Aloe-11]|uniref:hypothetical protein n=1 Tax=Paenibacillus sp. Aloe-11 TaxID=1050222 RepID=UPI00024EF591|nr:hypothetical protein [Paenibacillus sp. Aloe-11]EHS59108.1 hypothetical protein WG8_0986 [Paenibacillus sp. Aloe-11]